MKIKLTETRLKKIVTESIKRVLKEMNEQNVVSVFLDTNQRYDDDDFYESETEYQDCMESLDMIDNSACCVIVGTLGLWHGVKEIYPEKVDYLTDAVEKCLNNADDAKVSLMSDGTIQVEASHHDGSNSFTIIGLNRDGDSAYYDWEYGESDDDNVESILNNPNYRYSFKQQQ